MRIDVSFTPTAMNARRLEGRQVVILDVLRCTTTMLTALAHGARGIIPVADPAEAAELRAKLGAEMTLLGGERGGVRIENFDLGNSPLEYTRMVVEGRIIILCTTNGTAPFGAFRYSGPVWVGAFLNVTALVAELCRTDADVAIICAGNEGDFSVEDTLCAGAIVAGLENKLGDSVEVNDSARVAGLLWRANCTRISAALQEGEHAKRLLALGFGEDIQYAATYDSLSLVGQFVEGKVILPEGVKELPITHKKSARTPVS